MKKLGLGFVVATITKYMSLNYKALEGLKMSLVPWGAL